MTEGALEGDLYCHGTWSHENTEMVYLGDGDYQCPECGAAVRFEGDVDG